MEKINKTTKLLALLAIAFTLGLSANNFASSKVPANFNVAVVDIQKVVASTPQVEALKIEQKNKLSNLAKFVEDARTNLTKEKNEVKRKTLEDKYNKELNIKKNEIDKEYSQKLSDIDKNITEIVKTKATKEGYDLVLAKSVVLIGGTDITAEIIKELK